MIIMGYSKIVNLANVTKNTTTIGDKNELTPVINDSEIDLA